MMPSSSEVAARLSKARVVVELSGHVLEPELEHVVLRFEQPAVERVVVELTKF